MYILFYKPASDNTGVKAIKETIPRNTIPVITRYKLQSDSRIIAKILTFACKNFDKDPLRHELNPC